MIRTHYCSCNNSKCTNMDKNTFNGIIVLSLISSCFCQHYQQQEQQYYNTPAPPQIISHKQAQNHDGGFKYAFAAENGLAQGESIAPDGSRTGGYTYVDPHGKKISVKYTAGKEGFRILEGDHIPRAPLPVQQVQQAGYTQPQPVQHYGGYQQQNRDDGQYRPEIYEKPYQGAVQYTAPLVRPAYEPARFQAPIVNRPEGSSTNALDAFHDEPGKPYSFGKGFSFEFGG